jgi:hypothetical protein
VFDFVIVQAISLIVTHRTDDMSTLPKTGGPKAQKAAKSTETKRYNLRLPGAPQPLVQEVSLKFWESSSLSHFSFVTL